MGNWPQLVKSLPASTLIDSVKLSVIKSVTLTGQVPPLVAEKAKSKLPLVRSNGPIFRIVLEVLSLVMLLSELAGKVQDTASGVPSTIP